MNHIIENMSDGSKMYSSIKAIYDRHKIGLDILKENRADELNQFTDAEMRILDEYIRSMAAMLGDIYREVIHPNQEAE